MIKFCFRACLPLLILLGASNYLLYLKTGNTMFSGAILSNMSLDKFTGTFSGWLEKFNQTVDAATPAVKELAYKWTDDNGVVHFSAEPPQDLSQQTRQQTSKAIHTANIEKIELDPNVNVIQGIKLTQKPKATSTVAPPKPLPAPTNINPMNVKKLIEDSKEVQTLLNERAKKQQRLIN